MSPCDYFWLHNDDDQDTMGVQDTIWGGDVTNALRVDVDTYDMLLREDQKELYPGCNQYTVLSYVVELIHNKVDIHMTNKAIDKMLAMMKKICPKPNSVPESFRECKKILKSLGLGCKNIHACYYDCHVLMQHVLPMGVRKHLKKADIWPTF